ncbi:MAG: hypothetical protein ABSG25_08500, partial [Bryobacteraceae bacterium]
KQERHHDDRGAQNGIGDHKNLLEIARNARVVGRIRLIGMPDLSGFLRGQIKNMLKVAPPITTAMKK